MQYRSSIISVKLPAAVGDPPSATTHPLPPAVVTTVTSTTLDVISDIAVLAPMNIGYNPCADDNGGCEDLCLFNGESVKCACFHSVLADDKHTCTEYTSYLVYNNGKHLSSLHLFDDNNPNVPLQPIPNMTAYAMALDYQASQLYYSDLSHGVIRSVFLNGSQDSLFTSWHGSVEGLAVDPFEKMLYWTCERTATINRATLNDDLVYWGVQHSGKVDIRSSASNSRVTHPLVQLSKGKDRLRSIALDFCRRNMYWNNWYPGQPSIQRASFEGEDRTNIITREILVPNTLALDLLEDKLYWGDARLNKLERCNMDGSHRVVISLKDHTVFHPFQLRVYGEHLFWGDVTTGSVYRTNKYSGQTILLKQNKGEHVSLLVVAPIQRPTCSMLCPQPNPCSDLCSLDGTGQPKCSCLPDRVLQPDGHICTNCSPNEFVCGTFCIPFEYTCNGMAQCPDGSDEEPNYCGEKLTIFLKRSVIVYIF